MLVMDFLKNVIVFENLVTNIVSEDTGSNVLCGKTIVLKTFALGNFPVIEVFPQHEVKITLLEKGAAT